MFVGRLLQSFVIFSRRSLTVDVLANTSLYLRGKTALSKRAVVLPHFDLIRIVNNIPGLCPTFIINGNIHSYIYIYSQRERKTPSRNNAIISFSIWKDAII